ncbi:2-oxoglutarate-dependent dioxygenase 19-like isoform X1 [Aristolochia californica]|uniref:2-oxoglutarate-dependent dioxygenase 19-like isoform X1 n=1 Tax=Aristolochia californica TaxID=171875 RepID=UPI0035DD1D2D
MVVWEGFSILSSMASTSPININIQPRPSSTIKHLTEAYSLIELPPNYAHPDSDDSLVSRADTSVLLPTIDFSLLTSGSPAQRSQVIRDLAYACREWGFFMVINHGVREELREGIMEATRRFFNLPEEEKREFSGNHVLDPIRCGTSFNTAVEKVLCWRDFLKVFVHPSFHSPPNPSDFRDISSQYSTIIREMVRVLLGGISEGLGLNESYVEKALNLDDGFQILIGNFYPRCPQPQLAMGMPPHSDHGLLTVLIENNVGGLQVLHDGKWVQVQSIPNSFLVNIGDHLEILSNGRYKSVLHRAVVNSENTRISIAMAHGPSLETFVGPAPELVDDESHPAAYREMKYRDYLEFQQSNRLNGKTCLDLVRLSTVR